MSDADYAAFLEKANQGTGGATTQESKQYGTKSVNTAVPKSLERVEAIYISETDAEFEPVALAYSGSSISAGELKKVLDHDADVTEIAVKDFDPRGQYTQVVESVKEAGSGEAKVFRVEHGSTRAELYVVSVDEKDGRIVGLKVLVVES